MNKIKILDDATINKISAGEVIDRPSSIVKELIENSVDAKSKKIVIEIKKGGIKYIRISDDGSGISSDDVDIVFLRHATSKINNYHDLSSIYTMGFRGEALSSIASIAKINLFTKSQDEVLGTHAEYMGGKFIKKENIGCPQGTTIIVEDVFYNTPARYKFLKKESMETKYIIDIVAKEALINADISFELINNGKMLFKTSGRNNIEENIYDILGYNLKNHLIPVNFEYKDIIINGFITDINYYVKNQKSILLYINNRCVIDDTFKKAIKEAYKSLLIVHQYPVVMLNIVMPADRIDVNVHPSKLFVKLYEKENLYEYIGHKINNILISSRQDEMHILEKAKTEDRIKVNKTEKEGTSIYEKPSSYQYKLDMKIKTENSANNKPITTDSTELNNNVSDNTLDYKLIGQAFNTYIILEIKDELFIIDQHAAHERILYEKFSKEFYSKQIDSQALLIPWIIQLSHDDIVFIRDIKNSLESTGFDMDILGDDTLVVRAIPTILGQANNKDLITDLIEEAKQSKVDLHKVEKLNKIIMKSACKSAVKAYKKLSNPEINRLISDLKNCHDPYTCPHGRPTIIKKSITDIEKSFKRR